LSNAKHPQTIMKKQWKMNKFTKIIKIMKKEKNKEQICSIYRYWLLWLLGWLLTDVYSDKNDAREYMYYGVQIKIKKSGNKASF
jgi:hypothetical protein